MPRTRAKLGIPFVGKDVPSRSSEFAHPDIIIGLTVLAYRYEGEFETAKTFFTSLDVSTNGENKKFVFDWFLGLRYTDFNDIIASLRCVCSCRFATPFPQAMFWLVFVL